MRLQVDVGGGEVAGQSVRVPAAVLGRGNRCSVVLAQREIAPEKEMSHSSAGNFCPPRSVAVGRAADG